MNHPILLCMLFFFACISVFAQRSATPPDQIRLPDGFNIELLYSVPRGDQGSWVAMCQDDKGRLIVSDQHGGLYRFPIPNLGERVDPATIQQITYSTAGVKGRKLITGTAPKPMTAELAKLPKIGHAQGLCYAFDSLYVVVSTRNSSSGCGVFRLLDTDGDDNFDKLVELKILGLTAGEHGPHAIIPAPDGKHLYIIIGNQTNVPDDYSHSRVPEVWGEDQLLPSLQHFMKGAEAPLGHIAQIDPEGKTWEIVATGFRNQYDAAFNREGELFIRRGTDRRGSITSSTGPTTDGEPVPESLWISARTLLALSSTLALVRQLVCVSGTAQNFPPSTKTHFSPAIGPTENSMPFISNPKGRPTRPRSRNLPPPSPSRLPISSSTRQMAPCISRWAVAAFSPDFIG